MERSIPATLWKSQLLKLVSEAPKAVLIECSNSATHRFPTLSSSTSGDDESDHSGLIHGLSISKSKASSAAPEEDIKLELERGIDSSHSNNSNSNLSSIEIQLDASSTRLPTLDEPRKSSFRTKAAIWHRPSVYTFNPFGLAFHGYLRHSEAKLLLTKNGHFLVRKRERDAEDEFILTFRFNSTLKSYLLTYDDNSGLIYIGDREKGYPSVEELVQEGLITIYLDHEAGPYIDLMFDMTNSSFNTGNAGSLNSFGLGQKSPSSEWKNHSPSPSTSIERRRGKLNTHAFDLHTFQELSKCQICHNFLWGLSAQGLLCKDCGLSIHTGCLDRAGPECEPKFSQLSSLFGTDLIRLVKANGGDKPPNVLQQCIQQIDKRGLHIEGIYRVSGSKELTERLRHLFDQERENADLSGIPEIHSICSLVKLFLRQLPNPLISKEFFNLFIEKGEIKLEEIRKELKKLSGAHYITLKYLLQHLHRVAEQSERNKMNPFNLSSVFAPSLICPSQLTMSTLKTATSLIEVMITQVPNLFPTG